jgi:pimeloyl-ACP methyl ester carboxylesterase
MHTAGAVACVVLQGRVGVAEISIDGEQYCYRTSKRAPADGPVLLCVHGSGGDGVIWSYQLSRLSRACRVIVPDLPGHGQSGGSVCCRVEGYADWLERFVESLQLESVCLMGHSLGGAIVQEFARRHRDTVRGVVLAGTAPRFVLSRRYVQALGLDRGGDPMGPSVMTRAADLLRTTYGEHFQALAQSGIDVLHADIVAAGRFDSRPWVSGLDMPALVIAGAADAIMPPERSRELAQVLPRAAFVVLEGAGHTMMLDCTQEFNQAVSRFMEASIRDGARGSGCQPLEE